MSCGLAVFLLHLNTLLQISACVITQLLYAVSDTMSCLLIIITTRGVIFSDEKEYIYTADIKLHEYSIVHPSKEEAKICSGDGQAMGFLCS